MKASIMERKFRMSVKSLLWFVTEYINIIDKKSYDSTTVQVTFRKTMITNDKENVEIARDSTGIVSDETIVSHYPWVENVSEKLDRLKAQQEELDARGGYGPFGSGGEEVDGDDTTE